MKHNFYVSEGFDQLIKDHKISKSNAARFGILAADPNASWIVLLKDSDRIASTPIFADTEQLKAMNDHLQAHQFAETYAWYPCHNLDEAYEVWHREVQGGKRIEFGIIGTLRSWQFPALALVTPDEYA